jgi:TusA-related sulfurtransferase
VTSLPEPTVVVDARGTRCPVPVIELAKRIGDVAVGGVVAVQSDDPASRSDIPAWCRMRGHDYVGETSIDNAPAYLVRRAG